MQANTSVENLENLNSILVADSYISHKQSVDAIVLASSSLPIGFLGYISLLTRPSLIISALRLRKIILGFERRRIEHNNIFVQHEIVKRAHFFSNINGKSLDEQQLEAVIPDEDNVLVIAGAGSGKTLTIEAKVKYLIECLGVSAHGILPISFTKKSAEDMKARINVRGVEPQTFHKFGLTAVQTVERRKPKIFEDSKNDQLFRSFINELSLDSSYLAGLANFFLNYIKIPVSEFDFNTLGDYIQYLKDQNFTTYRKVTIPYRGKSSFKNETVKSIQECIIANFLLFNRIEYKYEEQYEFPISPNRKTKYEPDFTLYVDGKKIYLENFGIDHDNNVPAFFAGMDETYEQARKRYLDGITWKRNLHEANGTIMLETYSFEFTDGDLLDNLTTKLQGAGISLNPMTDEEMWEVIQDSGKDEVDAFISLVTTFLSLMKSNSYEIKDLKRLNKEKNTDDYLRERGESFLLLFEPLYSLYANHLHETDQIDFNDMITLATEYIKNSDYIYPVDYVIVDEFQDLSVGRYRILEAIRIQNPDVKFYCVGDDWQSVFRFTGSDIALFRDFEEYFGYTIRQKIETTYRFNEPLIALSSQFILKNPNQTDKSLRAPLDKQPSTLSIIESDSTIGDDTESLKRAIHELVDEHGLTPDDTVYLIGRYNFDYKRIMNYGRQFRMNPTNMSLIYNVPNGVYKGKDIKVDFFTAHRSKGLEADYTIIINCNSGKYGFPSGKADDPLLNLLLSSADQFENGEERRLFYVAVTRTKKHVVLLADKSRKSKFIKELQDNADDRALRCPKCKQGDLVLRSGKGYKFYGCSNFAYGCDYTRSFNSSNVRIESEKPFPPVTFPVVKREAEYIAPEREDVLNSGLTKSEKNRLDSFVSNPLGYTSGSEVSSHKIIFLETVADRMSDEERAAYNKALRVYYDKMSFRS